MPTLDSRLRDAVGQIDANFPIADLRQQATRRRVRRRALRGGSVFLVLALLAGLWFGIGREGYDRLTSRNGRVFPDKTGAVLVFDDSDMAQMKGETHYSAVAIVDLDHRIIERRLMAGLAPGDETYGITPVGHSLVTYGGEVWSHPLDGTTPRRLDGPDAVYIPSSDPRSANTVWSFRYGQYAYTGTPTVRQVDETGAVIRSGIGMNEDGRTGHHPETTIHDLIVYAPQTGTGITLWNPVAHRIVDVIPTGADPHVLGALADTLAWCDGNCSSMHIRNALGGTDRVVHAPRGMRFDRSPTNVAFDPNNGRWIAVMAGTPRKSGALSNDSVVMIDTATWKTKVVYHFHATLPEGCRESEINMTGCGLQTVAFPSWARDSKRVFFTVVKPKTFGVVTIGEYDVLNGHLNLADIPLDNVIRFATVNTSDAQGLLREVPPLSSQSECTKAKVQADGRPCGFRF
jgi:hypothetical protein